MTPAARRKAWTETLRTVWVLSLAFGLMAMLRGAGIQYVDWLEPQREAIHGCDGAPSFEACQAAFNAAATARAASWFTFGLALCLVAFVVARTERRRARGSARLERAGAAVVHAPLG